MTVAWTTRSAVLMTPNFQQVPVQRFEAVFAHTLWSTTHIHTAVATDTLDLRPYSTVRVYYVNTLNQTAVSTLKPYALIGSSDTETLVNGIPTGSTLGTTTLTDGSGTATTSCQWLLPLAQDGTNDPLLSAMKIAFSVDPGAEPASGSFTIVVEAIL